MSAVEMEAGREMDAVIAERVIGLPAVAWNAATPCPECGECMRYCGERSWCSPCSEWRYSAYREYSADFSAAWDVAEFMREHGFDVTVLTFAKGGAACEIARPEWRGSEYHEAEDIALAICRAALAAVEAKP